MNSNNNYDTILCDLGNVLVDFDHRIAVRQLLDGTPKREEDIYELFFDSPLTGLYEEGKIRPDEFFQRTKEFLKLNIQRDRFFSILNEIFYETPLNIKMHNFLRSIKPKYKLVMVSNINELHFEFLSNKMDIFNAFDRLILSYEVGFRKPAPQIYNRAIESVGTEHTKVFYIDDREDLIASAQKMGIKGIVFDGEEAFEKIVKELDRVKWRQGI